MAPVLCRSVLRANRCRVEKEGRFLQFCARKPGFDDSQDSSLQGGWRGEALDDPEVAGGPVVEHKIGEGATDVHPDQSISVP